jgi:AmmeMemoRadiSam system protein A
MESTISDDLKARIIALAREALRAAVEKQILPPLDQDALPHELQEPGATFVTLTKDDALRGCIGTLEARIPLAEDIRQHTLAAALHDFRFHPIRPEEIDDIRIEVSLLNQPRGLEYENPQELVELIRPGIDGVILSDGIHRATFLPQVWERIPSPTLFLSMLCEKAGLPSDAWRKEPLQVSVYQVETIHEERTHKIP